jgi:pimeloyl-ACP methyl ester carboxylesterase
VIGSLASIDTGSGPPVVLLHGQPGSGASWDPITRMLESECRVLAPDRVGYGDSAGQALGLAENADVVAEFIRDRRASPATVVAHSWSGGVAVLLASRHPTVVNSLVLVGAACTPDSINSLDRWLNIPVLGDVLTVAGLVGIGEVLPPLRALTGYVPSRFRDQVETALPDRSVSGAEPGTWRRQKRTFMLEQRALVDELPAVTAALGGLDLPVAVVSGTWDLVVPPRAAVSLARAVPGAELHQLPRTGHYVARDSPQALVEVVRHSVRSASSPEVEKD